MSCFHPPVEENVIVKLAGNCKAAHVMGSSHDKRNHLLRYKNALKRVPEGNFLIN